MVASINASTSAGVVTTADTSGILQLQTASTAALTIDASQNVGIGTASPAYKLDVSGVIHNSLSSGNYFLADQGGTNTLFQQIQNSGVTLKIGTENSSGGGIFTGSGSFDAVIGTSSNRNLSFGVFGATKMTLANTGNLLLGTTTDPAYSGFTTLAVNSATGALIDLQRAGTRIGSLQTNSTDELRLYAASGVFTSYYAGGSERMRITSAGYVGIGTTSPTVKLFVAASDTGPRIAVDQTADNAADMITFRRNGSERGKIYISDSATVYQTSSDYRLKKNITPLTGSLETVAKLKPSSFTWVQERGGQQDTGFIAHELAEVMPQAVTGEKDATREEQYEVTPAVKDEEGNITTPAVMGTRTVPAYQGIDTSFLVATLTAAIQELKAINDTQAETINALTARIVALEQK